MYNSKPAVVMIEALFYFAKAARCALSISVLAFRLLKEGAIKHLF
jgi:hypothetical protein